jgi:hypothetical protein
MQTTSKQDLNTKILKQIGLTDVEIKELDTVPHDSIDYFDMIFVRNNLHHPLLLTVHGKTKNFNSHQTIGSNRVVCSRIDPELESKFTTIEFDYRSNPIGNIKPIVAHAGKIYNINAVVIEQQIASR